MSRLVQKIQCIKSHACFDCTQVRKWYSLRTYTTLLNGPDSPYIIYDPFSFHINIATHNLYIILALQQYIYRSVHSLNSLPLALAIFIFSYVGKQKLIPYHLLG